VPNRAPRLAGVVGLLAVVWTGALAAQQVSDTVFRAPIERPRFAAGTGPVVAIDAGHHDFHTADGRFRAFAQLMRDDGYRVRSLDGPITPESLRGVKVLVIANALAEANLQQWALPTPSAFTDQEIGTIAAFVRGGGGLLLAADHMPFPGAAGPLATAFSVTLTNGFVFDSAPGHGVPAFTRAAGTLRSHPITDGQASGERIDSVRSFTGEGFRVPRGFTPLMVFGPGAVNYLPKVAWEFDSTTTRESAEGMVQAAAGQVGRGRVVVTGEAGMLTAQLARGRPMGMNVPSAPQNWRFVRQAIRWLAP
jgi:hypothetical protein